MGGDSHQPTTPATPGSHPGSQGCAPRCGAPVLDRKGLANSPVGLQSCKTLLDKILGEDEGADDRARLLTEYLQSNKPRDNEELPVYLPDIMETWQSGAQANNEPIMSAAAIVLDLLLQFLSRSLATVPYGIGLCRTLLRRQQQELIARNLSVDKGKTFIICPTLRMLREAICFDGGVVAKPIFRARGNTFKSLARNMGIRYTGEGTEDRQRTSARTTAVRLYLCALKYLHVEAKQELLSQRDMVAALTRNLQHDPAFLVLEILQGLKQYVLQDDQISRDARRKLLNGFTLSNIATLYNFSNAGNGAGENAQVTVEHEAHEFLIMACTVPSAGLLRQETGFYPKSVLEKDEALLDLSGEDVTLEQLNWLEKLRSGIPIRNEVLATFIQSLRPWSSVKQSELVVAVFRTAPELVAHFFLNKPFSFEPKLSATWIGYAAFLFNTASLPIPDYFGWPSGYHSLPPPTSVVVDNILPPPLNQKALSRCFTIKSSLVSFFATRILILALEKLDETVKLYQGQDHSARSIWTDASQQLVDEFCTRIPSLKDMMAAYRSIPDDNVLHREAASRLLRLYYEVIPRACLLSKFDISSLLDKGFQILSPEAEADPRDWSLRLMQHENLVAISSYSPAMRWFSKVESLKMTPFTLYMKVYADAPPGFALDKLLDVLCLVAEEYELVGPHRSQRGLLPLLESVKTLDNLPEHTAEEVWGFLDNCVSRCAAATVRYRDLLLGEAAGISAGATAPAKQTRPVSLIWFVMLEQLPFFTKTANKGALAALAGFSCELFLRSVRCGEDPSLLEHVFHRVVEACPPDLTAFKPTGQPEIGQISQSSKDIFDQDSAGAEVARVSTAKETVIGDKELEEMLHSPDLLAVDNSALTKWSTLSVDELLDEGHAHSLICLLASEHTSIRKEALTNILRMALKIQQSEYDEKEQIWLLLSEVAETAKEMVDSGPLPSPLVAFAYHALDVLKNPLHCLYPKTNQFLTRAPLWDPDKVPLVQEIVQEEPKGNSFYAQVGWLATYALSCLRNPGDVDLFRRKRAFGPIFERIFALAGVPYMQAPLRRQLLRIIYRVTETDGSSSTLTTRFGIIAWLKAQAAMCKDEKEAQVYEALVQRMARNGDRERISRWSKGGIEVL